MIICLYLQRLFFFFLRRGGSTCFCGCFDSFPSVAKLRLSQGVKLSLGIFLSASKQIKELLCAGCTSWAFLSLSLCSKEQGSGLCISVKGKVTMGGGNPLSRDDPWWESRLLAPAACPWASHLLTAMCLCWLTSCGALKGFIHVPNYSWSPE